MINAYSFNYEVYELRSELFKSLGNYEEAFTNIDQVIAMQPNAAAPHFRKARWQLEIGFFKEAVDCLNRALELDNGYFNETAHFLRAEAFLRLGEYKKALNDCEKLPETFVLRHIVGYDVRTKAQLLTDIEKMRQRSVG